MDAETINRPFRTEGPIWIRDFELGLTSLKVRKTGVTVPYSPSILAEVSAWFRFFFAVKAAAPLDAPPFSIYFTPERARPWYLIWPTIRMANGVLAKDAASADVVMHFDDATFSPNPPPNVDGAKLVNFGCRDVSKSRVAAAFEEAFGYPLAIDPTIHVGPAVEKSEINGAHDGRIVQCPMSPLPRRIYQRLVDARGSNPDLVDDLRTPTVGGKPVCVFIKRRSVTNRFANSNSEVELARVEDIYSPAEVRAITAFTQRLGLDWGGLDVLRDRGDGRLYIVDANKTDMGPPIALPVARKLEATRMLATAFREFIGRPVAGSSVRPMVSKIPYVRDMDFTYGEPQQVSPLIRRVVANNPGPFTYKGTGVYIVGKGDVAIIDPGPDMEGHLDVLMNAVKGERVTHIFVTHGHMDHSPAARPLAALTGAKIYASGTPVKPTESDVRMEAGDDLEFRPDVVVEDGQRFSGPGWTIEAVSTPGHTSHHMAYALVEENALFPGDHIMGWSTTVISPPDGDMTAYLENLEKVRDRDYATLWPTHGPPVRDVRPFVEAYIAHRLNREAQIIAQLQAGKTRIKDMVPVIYADVDKRLHPAACHSVLAHMIRLVELRRVRCDGPAGIESDYSLT